MGKTGEKKFHLKRKSSKRVIPKSVIDKWENALMIIMKSYSVL